jgi:tripartite-type tricarboxylate transporter receptor subunit TctC
LEINVKNIDTARRHQLRALGAWLASGLFASTADAAAAYPTRPIILIVPFPAGGPTDVTARIYAQAISAELGQPVVIDNRPGAGGTLGGGQAARAVADGYTLLWGGTSTLAVAPSLYAKIPYHPVSSFQPISRAVIGPLVLAVSNKLDVRKLSELVALAKGKPGVLNFGSAGVGSIIHLTGELFKLRSGADIVHIPYKGNAPVMTDLLAGQLDMAFVALGHMLPHISKGDIRAIAITSAQRNVLAPDLPTIAEEGYAGFESREWFGLVAPKGVPSEITARLNAAFRHASAEPSVNREIARLGYTSIQESPTQFADAMAMESQKWRDVIVRAKVEPL